MFRKLMNMADTLVWRYYELLTDLSTNDIADMQKANDPQRYKKELASRIVTDFHGNRKPLSSKAPGVAGSPSTRSTYSQPPDARLNRVRGSAKFSGSVTEADKLIKTNPLACVHTPPTRTSLSPDQRQARARPLHGPRPANAWGHRSPALMLHPRRAADATTLASLAGASSSTRPSSARASTPTISIRSPPPAPTKCA